MWGSLIALLILAIVIGIVVGFHVGYIVATGIAMDLAGREKAEGKSALDDDVHGYAATADLIGLTIRWIARSYLAEDDEQLDNLSLGLSDGTTLILSGDRWPWQMDACRHKPEEKVREEICVG